MTADRELQKGSTPTLVLSVLSRSRAGYIQAVWESEGGRERKVYSLSSTADAGLPMANCR